MTTVPEAAVELMSFTCMRCNGNWSQEFAVMRHTDSSGDVTEFYTWHGVPCAPRDVTCPHCGGLRVRRDPFSREYYARPSGATSISLVEVEPVQ